MYRCYTCALIFTSPQPKSVKNVNEEKYDSKEEMESRVVIYNKEYKRVSNYIKDIQKYKKSGKLLDVGCSYGILVKAAKDAGYDAWGIDSAKHAAAYGKNVLRVNIITGTLKSAKIKQNSFDIVTLYGILEHVPSIKNFLADVRRILKPGGLLVVQVPNIDSYAFHVLRLNWNWLLVPNHLWHFTIYSATKILQIAGFRVITSTSEDNVYDFASNYKSTIYFPILGSEVLFKGLRKIIYFLTYTIIFIGTIMWSKFYRGGNLFIYATKNKK